MHDLLDRLAPEVDVDAAWEEVCTRIERPRGRAVKVLAVGAAVALVAGGIVLATRNGSEQDRSTPVTEPPPEVLRDEVHGVELTVPPGWQAARTVLTPHLGEGPDRPWEVAAIGTYPLVPNGPGARCAQVPVAALNQLGPTDALVWVYAPTDFSPFDPRPGRFTDLDLARPEPSGITECIDRRADFLLGGAGFRDAGLNLTVVVAVGLDASATTRARALDALNSIGVVVPGTGTVTDEVAGLRITHPGDWQLAGQLTDQLTEGSVQVAAVGTYELRHDPPCPTAECRPRCADWPATAVEDLGPEDALVWIAEAPPELVGVIHAPQRTPFDGLPRQRLGSDCDTVDVLAHVAAFFEGGRVFSVHVVLGDDVSPRREGQAIDILNSLRFEERPP